ncbi:hypothetical protein EYF80_045748 [Liparis tanakae]|uniref:Uncharacterized protein n=1 Tax=Liparis tanakae TaxID=230148 RepID=A0A4Z2FTH3_9TELE|nr:hypothetical protein EYF80_045748 [Liparis tanakae]
MFPSLAVDAATGSNPGISFLLRDTWTRAGIEPPTHRLRDGRADHGHPNDNAAVSRAVEDRGGLVEKAKRGDTEEWLYEGTASLHGCAQAEWLDAGLLCCGAPGVWR